MMKHDLPSGQTILIPPGLCEDGQELFRILAEQIDADGRLRGDDWLALGQLAQLQIDIANLQADIRVNGLTEDTDRNQCQRRIEVSTLNQMRGHFRSLLAQFGLTPKSKRGLASSDPTEPADPLDEL
jgi:P27 family predicted phage terminase small subunit